jgi:EmrB/QacA subfamily drug resistance transporter
VKRNFIWWTLLIASLASFIVIVDAFFLTVAITTLVRELHTTVQAIQAILAVYSLTIACLILLGAKLQDIVGRKRTFLYGALIYGVGTVIATFSLNAPMLFIGWSLLEGLGAALMLPATAALISSTYEGNERAFAFGVWAAIGGFAAAIGPLLGGVLATFLSWRVGFGLEAVIVVLMFALSGRLSETPPSISWRDLDVVGVVLSAASFFFVVVGTLSLADLSAWGRAAVLISIGILLLVVFTLWQRRRIRRQNVPLTDIRLFRVSAYSAGNVVNLVLRLILAGIVFILPIFLQTVTGITSFMTGVAFVPLMVAMLITSFVSGPLSVRLSPRFLVSVGVFVALIGSLLLRGVFNIHTQVVDLFPGTILIGAGLGLAFGPLINLILSSAPEEKQADASGIFNVSTNIGESLGTAVIGVLLLVSVFAALGPAVEKAYPNQVTAQDVKANLPQWVNSLKTTDLQAIKAEQNTTTQIVNDTVSAAMQHAIDGVSLFLVGGLIASLFIGRRAHAVEQRGQ